MKILVVDDIEQNLYMLQALLEGHGYEITTAGNGAEALEIARTDAPDMIISDILMPIMDGYALCRVCKKDKVLKTIPFIFYTATYTDRKDEKFALKLGAERFIVKPKNPDEFMEIIREVIDDHEAGRIVVTTEPILEDEEAIFGLYNEIIVRKLEDKMVQLEEANKAFQSDIIEHKRMEARIKHLNRILHAIRNVNQLITQERDLDRLIESACEQLTETDSYDHVWILLIDDEGTPTKFTRRELSGHTLSLTDLKEQSEIMACTQSILTQPGVQIINRGADVCQDCFMLARRNEQYDVMAIRLEFEGIIYGVMNVCVSSEFVIDSEERSLFAELAGDISFGLYNIGLEIERKQAEDKLVKNQYYLTKAQEIGLIGTWELDFQKDILTWTDENYKIFGVPLGTAMNTELFLNCVHPEDRDFVNEKWNTALNNEPFDFEHRIIAHDEVKWVREKAEFEFDTEGNPLMAIGFTQDITERKQAEEERENLLHEKGERVKELQCLYGVTESIRTRNTLEEIFQDVVDLIPLSWQYPEITSSSLEMNGSIFRSRNFKEGKWKQASEIRVMGKSSGVLEVYYLEERPESDEGPFLNQERNLIEALSGLIGNTIDRKQAEEELKQYENIVSSSTDMLALLDKNFIYLSANSTYLKAFELTPDELIGNSVTEVFGSEYFESVIKPHAQRCMSGEHVNFQSWIDFPAYEPMFMDVNYFPYLDPENEVKGFIVNGRNITDRKKAEEELKKHKEHLEELVEERTNELHKEIEERKQVEQVLREQTEELKIFNKAMVDREMRIIDLKEETNDLCKALGKDPRYPTVWKSQDESN